MFDRQFILLAAFGFLGRATGRYVSYETPVEYRQGDSVPLTVNKLVSSSTLTPIDYPNMPVCPRSTEEEGIKRVEQSSIWKRAMETLHGDAIYEGPPYELKMKEDVHCATLCVFEATKDSDTSHIDQTKFEQTIVQDYAHQMTVDGMPVAFRTEDDVHRTTLYWKAIPMGTTGDDPMKQLNSRYEPYTDDDVFVYNHLSIEIMYTKSPNSDEQYRIYRTIVEPFSIQTDFAGSEMGQAMVEMVNPAASCQAGNGHVRYNMLQNIPPQRAEGMMLYTYDVRWVEYEGEGERKDPYKSRWNIFLTSDHAVPTMVEFVGILTAIIVNCVVWGSLFTWVGRDWSYKPLTTEAEGLYQVEQYELPPNEEEMDRAMLEVRMWPLSTSIFFPPTVAPNLLCVFMGTGAQILCTGAVFLLLFRTGLVSQSMGAQILTPGYLTYILLGIVGGYVTGRLHKIFHGTLKNALRLAAITGTAFPLLGIIVMCLVYDAFQDGESPNHNVLGKSFPLILIWLFCQIPLTVAGGYWGHEAGPVEGFPVSEGNMGYQDLDLPDGDKDESTSKSSAALKNRLYMLALFFLSGFFPVLGCFVGYAYGVAGPVLVGYYSNPDALMISDYGLFLAASGGIATLLYYRQIRDQQYKWWWTSFISGASAGFYIFLLTMTWLIYYTANGAISGRVFFQYMIWFAYLALAVGFMSGFVGVFSCALFSKTFYNMAMRYQ